MAQTFTFHGDAPIEFESVSAVTATNSVDLGTVRTFAGEDYVYVYNTTTTIPVGSFGVLSANSGFSVTLTSITQYDFPIGIVKHAAIPGSQYGWLLTRGFSKCLMHADNSAAVGDLLYPAAGGLWANVGIAKSVGCAIAQIPVGQVVSAAASGSSGLAFFKLYGA